MALLSKDVSPGVWVIVSFMRTASHLNISNFNKLFGLNNEWTMLWNKIQKEEGYPTK